MEIAFFSPSSLMASSCLPSKPYTSLSSRSSLFIANGGSLRSSLSPRVVSARRRSSGGLGCRCLFGLGVPELVVIAGVAALVFGPKKLPEIGRGIGKTVKSFQQAAKEFETELKKDPEDPPPESSVTSKDEKKELEAPASKESV